MTESVLPGGVPGDLLDVITEIGTEKLVASTAWEDATLESGWTNYGSGFASASYSLEKDANVVLRGRIKAGAVGTAVVFVLPDGHRPSFVTEHLVRSAGGMASVSIYPSGEVFIDAVGPPVGTVVALLHPALNSASSAPTLIGPYLYLNGAAISRTVDYTTLFSICGTAYGTGNGSTTFNVPDCRDGVLPIGRGPLFPTLNARGGASLVTLLEANLPSHAHNTVVTAGGSANPHQHDSSNMKAKGHRCEEEATGFGLTASANFQNRVLVDTPVVGGEYDIDIQGLTDPTLPQGANQPTVTVQPTGGNSGFSIRNPYVVIAGWGVLALDASTWVSLDGIRFRGAL